MKKLYLICNAHIDQVWQWTWEEGVAATLSTFRSAVLLSQSFDYIFCHNEAILYEWTETYDPDLFTEIRRLVDEGKWVIMGGWYLQPDCNMPSAESMVRLIKRGQNYFQQKFGVKCHTAINFDSFGHSAGLPQILNKTGYDNYICCRPMNNYLSLPEEFIWKGIEGSSVRVARPSSFYNQPMGKAGQKIEAVLAGMPDGDCGIMLWGVGNHGGGPSEKDLKDIQALQKTYRGQAELIHSSPDHYFKTELKELPVIKGGLNPCFPGCYTSQILIKQLHRRLENERFLTESICTCAAYNTSFIYPHVALEQAEKNLLFCQFHDILPGTTVQRAEESSIRMLGKGLAEYEENKVQAFLALSCGQPLSGPDEYPVLIFNPYPYEVTCVFEVSVMLADHTMANTNTILHAFQNGREVMTQMVKEESNIPIDWAKKVAIQCRLAPFNLTRYDLKPQTLLESNPFLQSDSDFIFDNGRRTIRIGKTSGRIESLKISGKELIGEQGTCLCLFTDNEDPWAMQDYQHKRLGNVEASFCVAQGAHGAEICGLKQELPAVRIVEDGVLFTDVECVLALAYSYAIVTYRVYKNSNTVDVFVRLDFQHKNKLLKFCIPTVLSTCTGQIMAGEECFQTDGRECVAQQWVAMSDVESMLAVINDGTYGFSAQAGQLEISLIRGAAYTAHYIDERPILRNDRYTARMDQGIRSFRFRILAGEKGVVKAQLPREAQLFNAPPYGFNMFPGGKGALVDTKLRVEGDSRVQILGVKKDRKGCTLVRLFNSATESVQCQIKNKSNCLSFVLNQFELTTIAEIDDVLKIVPGLPI